jgi:hypothetical protein
MATSPFSLSKKETPLDFLLVLPMVVVAVVVFAIGLVIVLLEKNAAAAPAIVLFLFFGTSSSETKLIPTPVFFLLYLDLEPSEHLKKKLRFHFHVAF